MLEVGYGLPIFEDFMYAMEKTRLTYIMEEEGPYTIFAPIGVSFTEFRNENKKIACINIRDIQGVNGIIHQIVKVIMPTIQNQ